MDANVKMQNYKTFGEKNRGNISGFRARQRILRLETKNIIHKRNS